MIKTSEGKPWDTCFCPEAWNISFYFLSVWIVIDLNSWRGDAPPAVVAHEGAAALDVGRRFERAIVSRDAIWRRVPGQGRCVGGLVLRSGHIIVIVELVDVAHSCFLPPCASAQNEREQQRSHRKREESLARPDLCLGGFDVKSGESLPYASARPDFRHGLLSSPCGVVDTNVELAGGRPARGGNRRPQKLSRGGCLQPVGVSREANVLTTKSGDVPG